MEEVKNIQFKKCPYCKEQILLDAIKCKHCGEFLDNESSRRERKKKKDSRSKVVVKTKEGFFLKSLNTGCLIVVILLVIVSVAIVIGSKMVQSQKARDEFALNQGVIENQKPVHDCEEANLADNYEIRLAGYTFIIDEKKWLKVPDSVKITPREDRSSSLILIYGEPGDTIEIKVSPLDKGFFWLSDPRGYEIFANHAYYIDRDDLKIEVTLQCDTPYMFVIAKLENSMKVEVIKK